MTGDRERESPLRGRGGGKTDPQQVSAQVAHHPPVERGVCRGPFDADATPLDGLDGIDEPPRRDPAGDLERLPPADAEITRRARRDDRLTDVDGGHPGDVELRPPRRHADPHPGLRGLRLERHARPVPRRLGVGHDRPGDDFLLRHRQA